MTDHARTLRLLISKASNMAQQLTQLAQLVEDASRDFAENENDPAAQQKIVARLSAALIAVKMHVLNRLVLDRCFSLYKAGGCSWSQYQLAEQLVKKMGAIEFVQKVLWGESVDDLGLSVALKEIIPTLETLVEDHPYLFLDRADVIISRVSDQDYLK